MEEEYVLEIYSGSTVDVGFLKRHLSKFGIESFVENKHDTTITAKWTDIKTVVGSSILVKAGDFEKADKLIKEYLNSRET